MGLKKLKRESKDNYNQLLNINQCPIEINKYWAVKTTIQIEIQSIRKL